LRAGADEFAEMGFEETARHCRPGKRTLWKRLVPTLAGAGLRSRAGRLRAGDAGSTAYHVYEVVHPSSVSFERIGT
jgi:hypothetical protein